MKTMKVYILSLLLFCSLACSSDKTATENNPAHGEGSGFVHLHNNYDLIMGFLSPERGRDFPCEIFVGTLFQSNDTSCVFPEGNDILLNKILRRLSYLYMTDIRGCEDASVYVTDGDNNKVEFIAVGNGFYSDINNQLKVNATQSYKLRVTIDSSSYWAEMVVPSDFSIANIHNGDTVLATRDTNRKHSNFQFVEATWTESKGSWMYFPYFHIWHKQRGTSAVRFLRRVLFVESLSF